MRRVVRIGIIVGLVPFAILILIEGLNVLFSFGIWVHWSLLIFYGVSMIFLGVQDLIAVNGTLDNLFKTEFSDIKFEKIDFVEKGREKLIKRSKKNRKQFLGVLSVFAGAITLLLVRALF